MSLSYQKNARVFKALCDENRLIILELLQSGEKCACQLLEEMKIGQSTLSHHMKILCDSGIVQSRREGKWTHYSICKEGVANAKQLLDQLTRVTPCSNEAAVCCGKTLGVAQSHPLF